MTTDPRTEAAEVRERLRFLLAVDQASAVLDMQVRRLPHSERRKVNAMVAELQHRLAELGEDE